MPKIIIKDKNLIDLPLIKKERRFFSFLTTLRLYFYRFFRGRPKFTGIIFILAILGIITAIIFFIRFNELKQNPTKEIDRQTKDLIARVSKLVLLPQDETPTVATVSDPEKLKDQPFFANAKKGYKVLIYTNAKKVILYDPFENRIVEIAPINLGSQVNPSTSTSK